MAETQAKQSEELGVAEEKLDNLVKIKTKLEVTLDELEESAEREKKSRLDMDKNRRKVEAEMTICQEQVTCGRRNVKELFPKSKWNLV